MVHTKGKKAKSGDTIQLIQTVCYGTASGLVKAEEGEVFQVVSRDKTDEGVYTDKGIHVWDTKYIITKGERDMNTYTGFAAIDRMKTHWIQRKGAPSALAFTIEDSCVLTYSPRYDDNGRQSDISLEFFFKNEFVDYEEKETTVLLD